MINWRNIVRTKYRFNDNFRYSTLLVSSKEIGLRKIVPDESPSRANKIRPARRGPFRKSRFKIQKNRLRRRAPTVGSECFLFISYVWSVWFESILLTETLVCSVVPTSPVVPRRVTTPSPFTRSSETTSFVQWYTFAVTRTPHNCNTLLQWLNCCTHNVAINN